MNERLSAYQQTSLLGSLEDASPHRLIQMLLDGCIQRVVRARQALDSGRVEQKVEAVQKALSILDGLAASLDMEQGEIARNLDELYAYMKQRLVDGNCSNRPEPFDEVVALLREIKMAWDAMPMVMRADSQPRGREPVERAGIELQG